MKTFLDKFAGISQKIKEIPKDRLPDYEHVGRFSSFGMWAVEKFEGKENTVIIPRNVHKSLGNVNRMAYIWFIYQLMKDKVPFPKFNDYYGKLFMDTIYELTYTDKNLKDSLERIKTKVPKEIWQI